MPETSSSSVAGIITAIATLITALGGVALTFTVLIPMFRTAKNTNDTAKSTHQIVNQEKTDRDNFNRTLVRELKRHGIAVPVDQSLPDEPQKEAKGEP